MARWSDTVDLISIETDVNKYGDVISITEKETVYANKLSIRQSEFYQAQATGLRPELAFEIHSMEYDGQEKLEHEHKTYSIIRTFDKGEFIELICQGVVNDGNT